MSNIYDTSPARGAVAVTASDSTLVSPPFKALFIGTSGNVALKVPGSTTAVTFKNLASGSILPVKAEVVMSTNTTATDIVGLR